MALGPVFTWEGRRTKDLPDKGSPAADLQAKDLPAKASSTSRRHAFTPAYGEGFFYAAVSALGYGTTPVFVRFGLEGGGLGRGVAAGLISYAAATLVIVVVLCWPGSLRQVGSIRKHEFAWFMIAGLFVGVAQMLRYMALALVPVSIVAPMMRLTSIFRFYFSWLLNREYEQFSKGVFIGTAVSLTGAVILTVSSDFVLSLLPPSEAMTAFLKWRWP